LRRLTGTGEFRTERNVSPRQRQSRHLLVGVDRSRVAPIGRQLEEQLRNAMRSGALSPGIELPSTRALAEDLGVSRGVVVRAYSQLAAEGYLDVRQGANPSVRAIPDSQPASIAAQSRPLFPKVQYDLRAHLPEVSTFPRHVWLRSVRNALASAT